MNDFPNENQQMAVALQESCATLKLGRGACCWLSHAYWSEPGSGPTSNALHESPASFTFFPHPIRTPRPHTQEQCGLVPDTLVCESGSICLTSIKTHKV